MGATTRSCQAPFASLEFDPFGNVQSCCANSLFPLGNVERESIDEIWRGRRANVLRAAVTAGDLSMGCAVCAFRIRHDAGEVPIDYYGQFPAVGGADWWPQLLTFNLHNTCNLECVMCGPDLSSRIRRHRTDLAPLPHVYQDRFFEELVPFLEHCSAVDFAGGEPFLVREHRRVFDLLEGLEEPPAVAITTNATVWNDHVEHVLDTFHPHVCVSVDALTPRLFEEIRVGASIDSVMTNIDRFLSRADRSGATTSLSFSLLDRNWFELGAVLLFAEQRGMTVSVQTVHERPFGIQWLPTDELRAVVDLLDAEDRAIRAGLELNREIWDQQIRRLRVELSERERGNERPPMMTDQGADAAAAVERVVLGSLESASPETDEAVDAHRELLSRWTGSPPTEAVLDDDGRIVTWRHLCAVADRLNLGGRAHPSVNEVLRAVAEATGSHMWTAEEVPVTSGVRYTLWFSLSGSDRDRRGLVLQMVAVRGTDDVVLMAFDDHLAPAPVAVSVDAPAARRNVTRPGADCP